MNPETDVSRILHSHYERTFAKYGPTPQGVDWGPDPADHLLRMDRMLAILEQGHTQGGLPSLLDVGCGYGGLADLISDKGLHVDYCGIDMCAAMIEVASKRHVNAKWIVGDIMSLDLDMRFDYVVCNGVLTQKLDVSLRVMDEFLRRLVARIFRQCRVGVAFNVMTTHVNYMMPNLYYKNPAELIAWCMTELTTRIRVDHAYPLYEYTLYLYKEDAPGLSYGSHRGSTP